MAKAQAIVETANGSRYLQQLCKHWAHKFAVDFTPQSGSIDLGEGRLVSMSADATALTIDVQADDLEKLQHVVAVHIERFAFRETLSFDWRPA